MAGNADTGLSGSGPTAGLDDGGKAGCTGSDGEMSGGAASPKVGAVNDCSGAGPSKFGSGGSLCGSSLSGYAGRPGGQDRMTTSAWWMTEYAAGAWATAAGVHGPPQMMHAAALALTSFPAGLSSPGFPLSGRRKNALSFRDQHSMQSSTAARVTGRVFDRVAVDLLPDLLQVVALAQRRDNRQRLIHRPQARRNFPYSSDDAWV